jgi:cytochrome c6
VRGFVQSLTVQSFTQVFQPSLLSPKIHRIFVIVIPVMAALFLFFGMTGELTAIAAGIDPPPIVKTTTAAKFPDKTAPKTTPLKAEASLGEKIFTANCAACHIGGNNIILSEKNLSKDALEQYAMNSVAAIKTQVTSGKNAMPAFGESLTSAEIEAVARYVITQSQIDWKGSSVGLQ